jgi:hypothetical protein
MSTDLLEKLAELPVPPPPPQRNFERAVHVRINNRLIVGHVIDFLVRGFAFATVHFFCALVGFVRLTLTGKMDLPKNGRNRRSS